MKSATPVLYVSMGILAETQIREFSGKNQSGILFVNSI
jgi:hypothetical protein